MIKAVIFDMDGVLIDSEESHLKAFNKVLTKFNVKLSKEHYRKYFGMGALYIMQDIFRENNIQDDVYFWTKKKDEYYRDLAKHDLKPFPYAAALIKRLHSRFKIAIASSAVEENIKLAIKRLNIGRYISCFVSGDHVKKAKPWPDIYLLCARRLKLKPDECVVIEDAIAGIEAAKKAGMRCIAVTHTVSQEKLTKADAIVDNLKKINMDTIRRLG